MKILKVFMVFAFLAGFTISLASPSQGVVNTWAKKNQIKPIIQKPVIQKQVLRKQVSKSKKISMQDFVKKKLNEFFKKRRAELNDLAILSKDSSFDFLVSSNEKDFVVITKHNQSLDDLIKNQKIWIRFGRISFTELEKNRGAPKDIRIFVTKDAVEKFRSGILSNLAILSTLKPLAGAKDYLNQKGECGERNKPPTSGTSQSGDRVRNQLNRQGQYMDKETGSSDMPANPGSITRSESYTTGNGDTHTIFEGDDGTREEWVGWDDPETGDHYEQMERESYEFEPARIEGRPLEKGNKQDDKDKDDDKADDTATAEPAAEPEAPSGGAADPNDPRTTPKEDSGGGNMWSFCNSLAGSMARQQCKKQVRNKIFGSNDPLVLKEDSSKGFPVYTYGQAPYDSHVGPLDPYIIPTDEGGRGGHSALGADGCGGGVVRGSVVGNTFCYRAEGGDSRCDDGSGGGLPDAPGGGTEPGANPIPTPPGPGPIPGR